MGVCATTEYIVVGTGQEGSHQLAAYHNARGNFVCSFGHQGEKLGHVHNSVSVRVSPDGSQLFVVENWNGRVSVFEDWSPRVPAKRVRSFSGDGVLAWPMDLQVVVNGDLFVANMDLHEVCDIAGSHSHVIHKLA